MVISYSELEEQYSNYSNVSAKVNNLVKNGNLIKLKRGFYSNDRTEKHGIIANIIYSPSYVSFQSALAYYGMIPERVYATTSATALKGKSKHYSNLFGDFYFNDVPASAFPYGIILNEEGYKIATKEKALADMLYSLEPVSNQKELVALLFEDLRIDEDEFMTLSLDELEFILPRYRSTNTDLLLKVARKMFAKRG